MATAAGQPAVRASPLQVERESQEAPADERLQAAGFLGRKSAGCRDALPMSVAAPWADSDSTAGAPRQAYLVRPEVEPAAAERAAPQAGRLARAGGLLP